MEMEVVVEVVGIREVSYICFDICSMMNTDTTFKVKAISSTSPSVNRLTHLLRLQVPPSGSSRVLWESPSRLVGDCVTCLAVKHNAIVDPASVESFKAWVHIGLFAPSSVVCCILS
jgi:hypothetical protein